MTSRDSQNFILVSSRYLQSRRIRKLGSGSTIRVDPLSTHCRRTFWYKIISFGLELCDQKHLA